MQKRAATMATVLPNRRFGASLVKHSYRDHDGAPPMVPQRQPGHNFHGRRRGCRGSWRCRRDGCTKSEPQALAGGPRGPTISRLPCLGSHPVRPMRRWANRVSCTV